MDNMKLSIDLLPRGAWGNNLRETLSKDEWDTLRNYCYEKANHKCEICGKSDTDLDAHEVWEFDEQNKTQTLKDIIALCPACHGVKQMRNSIRIGYGEQSKAHFMRINKSNSLKFASHYVEAQILYVEAQILFEKRNEVLRWKLVVDLEKFGGKGFEIKEREIPLIVNPYEGIELLLIASSDLFKTTKINLNPNILEPKVRKITVNNYDGTISVEANHVNKIQWIADGELIKTKWVIGNLMGYCKNEKGEYEIVQQEAEIIRRVFKEYLCGYLGNQICDGLIADGIKYVSR